MNERRATLGFCVVAALAVSTVWLDAQRGGPAVAHPDFSGYWELRLDSFNVPAATLTPHATAAMAAQAKNDADALSRCALLGMPALMNDRAPLDVRHSSRVIGMVAKSPSSTRYVYLDGRSHPPDDELEGTTNGHSIGRWEGDTLIVDTVGFNDRGVTRIPGGGYRTPGSHLVERYRLLDNGQQLSVVFTWEDRAVFQQPQTYEFRYYRIRQISDPRMFNCVPNPERTRFLTAPPAAR
jgi:hypothetical protein